MEFKRINTDRRSFMNLLMIGDPDLKCINKYIDEGTLIAMYEGGKCIGVIHYKNVYNKVVEIMNIGILKSYINKGYGSKLLRYTIENIKSEGNLKIMLGTCDSSAKNVAFYKRHGFRILEVWHDYFIENYDEEIYEDNMQCRDMIRMEFFF
ncbi:MAG: GNAT family N-acetyltransferase [Acidaminobacteraceae bacterium]